MRDEPFERVLDIYRQRNAAERQDDSLGRDDRLLWVGEDVGRLLLDLAVGRKAQVIVELGSSFGFSTLFLAKAASLTGGTLYSYEIAPETQDWARERVGEAGLADHVDWQLGDAVELLADQPGLIDFVLLDLWKDLYIPCFDALHPKLADSGIVIADNMLFPSSFNEGAVEYRAHVRAKPDMEGALLTIGSGIDIAVKSGG
jgi:predicted O-methyltransferase YrrM